MSAIHRLITLLLQCGMYVAHIADPVSDIVYARDHPKWLCNWLPSELWARVRLRRELRRHYPASVIQKQRGIERRFNTGAGGRR